MNNDKPTIMIVDDSKTILRVSKNFLGSSYNVSVIENGFLALAEIAKNKPDVLFLDVVMPVLDGYNTCLALKFNPEYEDIPVVMLSSKDSPFDKARGSLMGCNDYLTKPFSKEALLESIRKHLTKEEL